MIVRRKQERGSRATPAGFHLSPQQHRILDQIERGARQKEAAAKLGISVNTLKTYAKLILLRTNATNLVEAAWLRRQHGAKVQ